MTNEQELIYLKSGDGVGNSVTILNGSTEYGLDLCIVRKIHE